MNKYEQVNNEKQALVLCYALAVLLALSSRSALAVMIGGQCAMSSDCDGNANCLNGIYGGVGQTCLPDGTFLFGGAGTLTQCASGECDRDGR